MLVGLLFVVTVPRLLNLAIKPDTVYPLYGFHDWVHRAIARMTNVKFFTHLFGDSSYIVHYLRWLGYDLSRVEQTGSNFGTEVGHETPYLSSVGSGTMVADGLSIMNADFSSTSFRMSRVSIGPHNFLGNNIAYPAGGQDGRQLPAGDEGRWSRSTGRSAKGSACWARRASRSRGRSSVTAGSTISRAARSCAAAWPRRTGTTSRTMGVFLLARWLHVFLVTVLVLAAADLVRRVRAGA